MALSRILRRSGIAVVLVGEWIKWRPNTLIQVGVGKFHQEIDVMLEAWLGLKVISYEAHPEICKWIKHDGFPGELNEVAIGRKQGKATLNSKPSHREGSSIFRFDDQESEPIEVSVDCLDNLWKGKYDTLKRPVLLWLDCEGSEYEALLGGIEFINHVDAINIEMTANKPSRLWPDTTIVHDWLIESGFLRQWIHTQRSGQYDAIYVRPNIFDETHCCSPESIKLYRRYRKFHPCEIE